MDSRIKRGDRRKFHLIEALRVGLRGGCFGILRCDARRGDGRAEVSPIDEVCRRVDDVRAALHAAPGKRYVARGSDAGDDQRRVRAAYEIRRHRLGDAADRAAADDTIILATEKIRVGGRVRGIDRDEVGVGAQRIVRR